MKGLGKTQEVPLANPVTLPFGLFNFFYGPPDKGRDLRVHAWKLLPRAALSEADDPSEGEPPDQRWVQS